MADKCTMESSRSSVEINVISAEDLRLGKAAFSVTVRTGSGLHEAASTGAARRDDRGCPSWNQKLNLPLPPLARSVSLEVRYASSSSSGSRPVAAVTVPLSDFAGVGPEGHLHFLSYRLRDARGERNGIINFSVRVFGDAARRQVPATPATAPATATATCRAGFGYQGQTTYGGVAVGYPVVCGRVVSS